MTTTHEVVHGIQGTSFSNPETCESPDAPKWFSEGTADGISHYLLSKRRPDVLEEYGPARNERRWDESLDSREVSISNEFTYQTGSFFRYLMETSEDASGNGLGILKDILTMHRSKLGSREGLLGGIEDAIKRQSGGRGLYQVLPEFLTEYGSYGVGRYKLDLSTPGSAAPMSHERWLDKSFGGCVDFNLTPGNTESRKLRVDDLAAECIHVTWSGFTVPVALQIFADGAKEDYGSLHLGEAVRKDADGTKYCYEATNGLAHRISLKMTQKCMMRRETSKVGSKSSQAEEVALWTSDFNLMGDGEAYFIMSNVALKPADTEEVSVTLIIGSVDTKSDGTSDKIRPRKPADGNPTQGGMTDPDKRLHAINGNEKRMLLDARSVFSESLGLSALEGIQGKGTIGKGVLTMVRGENYWIGFVGTSGKKKGKESALVIKNPAAFERSGYTDFMGGAIVGGGMVGGNEAKSCGYDTAAEVTLVEQNEKHMKFRIATDMFDMRRAMSAMSGSACGMMNAAHVERADFTVTLPYGKLYEGGSTIERGHPPGQDLYDNVEFLTGSNLGGIETSRQLAGLSPSGTAPGTPAGSSGAILDGNGGKAVERCACGCPRIARPPTDICMEQCIRVWNKCAAE
ncbi:MAG: hypothetical protein O2910_00360 [Proteobacteria bacterium]|nr:hypothetical protein [Pseudomonadota bacterium]